MRHRSLARTPRARWLAALTLAIPAAAAAQTAAPVAPPPPGDAAAGTTASDSAQRIEEQQRRLEEQEQRIRILERRLEMLDETAQTTAQTAPVVRAAGNRFSIQSADGANVLRVRGVVHFDGRQFLDDAAPATADTWILRRVRPTIEGTLFNRFDYRITPEFAGGRSVLLDAYGTFRFTPAAQLQVGKFKVPVGLERLVSANDLRFIERAFPTSLVPNRDLGVALTGELGKGAFNYALGYFNGVADGASADTGTPADAETDGNPDWIARAFFQPFTNSDRFGLRGLGFGVAATYGKTSGSSANSLLPSYRTPGQQSFFTYRAAATGATNGTFANGDRVRITPQFHYYYGRLGVLGEYARVSQDVTRTNGTVTRSDTVDVDAWHLQLAWSLTGEEQSFRTFTPGQPLAAGKPGKGGFEVVARVHQLTVDDAAFAGGANSFANPATAAQRATAAGVGLNWYPVSSIKISLDYEQTRFDGGAAAGDRPDERVLLTRFALGF